MKNTSLWRRLWRLARASPPKPEERRAKAMRYRQEAFGEITERTRAEDKQRLADAAGQKGPLI